MLLPNSKCDVISGIGLGVLYFEHFRFKHLISRLCVAFGLGIRHGGGTNGKFVVSEDARYQVYY